MTSRFIFFRVFVLVFFLVSGMNIDSVSAQTKNELLNKSTEDVNVTIDAITTDANFEDIKTMLADYGIKLSFSGIDRDKDGKLTGVKIELSNDTGQKSKSRISSNNPIGKLSFGRKNGNLYAGQANNLPNMFSMLGKTNSFQRGFESDSLISLFDPNDFFNDPNSMFLFSGDSLTIDQIKERMMQNFSFKNSGSDRFRFMFDDAYDNEQKRYKFIDDPNKKKIIVIDGEISNFGRLNALAETNTLDTIDILQPKTAMSIYGEAARDGAIIVTTKQ